MANNVIVEINGAGLRSLMHSSEMVSACKEQADKICGKCGEGYATDTYHAQTRAIASVYTDSFKAMKDNMDNNTLLKAMGGG